MKARRVLKEQEKYGKEKGINGKRTGKEQGKNRERTRKG
jgi:hypothetical protein